MPNDIRPIRVVLRPSAADDHSCALQPVSAQGAATPFPGAMAAPRASVNTRASLMQKAIKGLPIIVVTSPDNILLSCRLGNLEHGPNPLDARSIRYTG